MTAVVCSHKLKPEYLARKAIVYLRQSTEKQARYNKESQILHYAGAERVRALGWTYASHGYGHRHSAKISEGLFLDDTQKWRKEVENMVGPTQIYVYPYGEYVSAHGAKYNTMLDFGFKVMCGVSHKQEWIEHGDTLFMSRLGIDGYSLRNFGAYLAPLFDCETVIDKEYRR